MVGFEAPVPDGKVTVLEFKISFIRLKTSLKYMLFLFSIKLSNIAKEKKRVQLRFAKCKVFFFIFYLVWMEPTPSRNFGSGTNEKRSAPKHWAY